MGNYYNDFDYKENDFGYHGEHEEFYRRIRRSRRSNPRKKMAIVLLSILLITVLGIAAYFGGVLLFDYMQSQPEALQQDSFSALPDIDGLEAELENAYRNIYARKTWEGIQGFEIKEVHEDNYNQSFSGTVTSDDGEIIRMEIMGLAKNGKVIQLQSAVICKTEGVANLSEKEFDDFLASGAFHLTLYRDDVNSVDNINMILNDMVNISSKNDKIQKLQKVQEDLEYSYMIGIGNDMTILSFTVRYLPAFETGFFEEEDAEASESAKPNSNAKTSTKDEEKVYGAIEVYKNYPANGRIKDNCVSLVNSKYQVNVDLLAHEKVTDFKVVRISCINSNTYGIEDILYEKASLYSNEHIVVGLEFPGVMPLYGIVYTDKYGREKSFCLIESTSGENSNTVSLREIELLDFVSPKDYKESNDESNNDSAERDKTPRTENNSSSTNTKTIELDMSRYSEPISVMVVDSLGNTVYSNTIDPKTQNTVQITLKGKGVVNYTIYIDGTEYCKYPVNFSN